MAAVTQLIMLRPNLSNLPAIQAPASYEIRGFQPGDEVGGAETLALSFEDPNWTSERYTLELSGHEATWANYVAVIDGVAVATATARRQSHASEVGYVHYVGTHPAHTGHGLGFWVSLAVLHEFVCQGCTSATLHTDDFRLPAIKTYLKLGFRPVSADEAMQARWDKLRDDVGAEYFQGGATT